MILQTEGVFVNWSRFIYPDDKAGRLSVLRFKILFAGMLMAFVTYGIFHWVLWPVQILGDSMLPNYHAGERHFINKFAYVSDQPVRGDVVGVRVSREDTYIKRVIGLPGEEISFTNGVVFINGVLLPEQYVKTRVPAEWPHDAVKLAAETYYVMGDNRAVSVLGKIRIDQIVGKVVF
jgi:signal peptidase I